MPSEAKQDWNRRMDALIAEALPWFGMNPGAQLGDWLLVLSAPYLNEDGEIVSGYTIAFSGGNLLDHHALGLLRKGEQLLESGDEVD